MSKLLRRGESGSLVSSWNPSSSAYTPQRQTSQWNPYGLQVRNLIYGTHVTLTGNGTTVTATTQFPSGTPHGLVTGQSVIISLASTAGFNGTYTVTVTSATTFTYVNATTGTLSAQCSPSLFPQIPTGVNFVWAICVGAGGWNPNHAGGGGGIFAGWTLATNSNYQVARGCSSSNAFPVITSVISEASYYNTIFAPGGSYGGSTGITSSLQTGYTNQSAAAGSGANTTFATPSGFGPYGQARAISSTVLATNGNNAYYGAAGSGSSTANIPAGNGGNGVSGGAGGTHNGTTSTCIGGNGGNGFIGGGGGAANLGAGAGIAKTGGNGGSGRNLIDPTITYTGGLGLSGTAISDGIGGGGAGCLGNGTTATASINGYGGLGGGGAGGSATNVSGPGAIYILY